MTIETSRPRSLKQLWPSQVISITGQSVAAGPVHYASVEHYDAVVVGAGPAGAFSAYKLAQAGARVVLLERRRIPRPKPCGGGLTPKAYRQLDFPIDDLVCAKPHGVWLRGRGVDAFPLADPRAEIWMVQRPAFDRRIAERAVAAGAELRDDEPVRSVEPGAPATVRTE